MGLQWFAFHSGSFLGMTPARKSHQDRQHLRDLMCNSLLGELTTWYTLDRRPWPFMEIIPHLTRHQICTLSQKGPEKTAEINDCIVLFLQCFSNPGKSCRKSKGDSGPRLCLQTHWYTIDWHLLTWLYGHLFQGDWHAEATNNFYAMLCQWLCACKEKLRA